MSKVKITVLKTTLDKELAREYGAEGLTACPMMKEGQIFYVDYAKPEGFCDGAWIAIHPYVFSLVHGTGNELFYYGNWIRKRESPYAAAMTDCGLSYSKWSLPDRILPWNMSRSGKINRLV